MSIINETERLCAELQKTLAETRAVTDSFMRLFKTQQKEPVMAMSIRDALMVTNKGKMLVVDLDQAKAHKAAEHKAEQEAVGKRIRTLKELVHQTFVELPKSMHRAVRFDVYQNSKDHVRELGIKGGAEYDYAVRALKATYDSKSSYRTAIETVVPPELDPIEHNLVDYDSSDFLTRY